MMSSTMSSTIEQCIACSCLITTFLLLDLTLIISNVTAESIMLRQNRFSMKSAVALIFSDCIFVVGRCVRAMSHLGQFGERFGR